MNKLIDSIAFDSFTNFLEMGGHGFYVWLCYAIVIVALVWQFIWLKRSLSKHKKQLKRYYQRMEKTQAAKVKVTVE